MNFNKTIPVYIQICDIIIQDILNGKYKYDSKIPSIKELAANYVINQNTVIHAYNELSNKNIIESRRGLGYFVCATDEVLHKFYLSKTNSLINNFIKEIKKYNISKEEVLSMLKEVDFNAIS